MSDKPPKWADRLLEWYCKAELLEEIQGDLHELYRKKVNDLPGKLAALNYWLNVLLFFKPSNIKHVNSRYINLALLKLNFKSGYRSLLKSRTFSLVNIIGLCLSFCACLIIYQHISHQKSFDKFHSKSDRIFRIAGSRYINQELQYSRAMTLPEIGMAMEEYFPEVEESTRIFPVSTNIEPVFKSVNKNVSFSVPNAFLADSTFLEIFDLKFISGNPDGALSGSNKIIISETIANRFFGNTNVVGEVLASNFNDDWVITGVFEDMPSNSHFKPEALMSWFNVYGERSLFTWDGFYTYLLLNSPAEKASLVSKLNQFKEHYLGDYLKDKPAIDFQFMLQPLEEIYLHSSLENEFSPTGHNSLINVLSIIGILILCIAVVNHINFNTSKTIDRTKEVGIKKVIGSSKAAILIEFLLESFILNSIAFIVAALLIINYYPELNTHFGTSINLESWTTISFWLMIIGILSAISLLSALYPLLTLSRVKVYNALKGLKPREGRAFLKKGLVTFQFAISLILIICTLGILNQLEYVKNFDLGFNANKKIVMKLLPGPGEEMDSTFNQKIKLVKDNLKSYSFISNSTVTSTVPGVENVWLGRTQLEGQEALISAYLSRVDEDFLNTYNLHLLAGNNFHKYSDTLNQIIINLATVKSLGLKNPEDAIGKNLIMGSKMEIIGVVESMNEQSLHKEVAPSMYWMRGGYKKYLTINITGNNMTKQVAIIEKTWKAIFPDRPFDFLFLDDFYNQQYKIEVYTSRIITAISFLAIVIACMGLFSHASYTLYRKTKEIGIRKIFGATVSSIATSFALRFTLPLIFAALLAMPASYLLLEKWLQQYAYKMSIEPFLFLIPFLGLLTIALAVILTQSIIAAFKNPAESLKIDG